MKILHANDHYSPVGGAEIVLFNILEVLEEKGHENVMVYQHAVPEVPSNRRAHLLPGLGDSHLLPGKEVTGRFQEILQEEKPDLIHLHDVGNPEIAETARRFGPAVQTVFNHSFYCPGGQKYLPFLKRECRRSFGPGCLVSAFLTHCNSVRPHELAVSYRRSQKMLEKRSTLFLVLSQYQARCFEQNGVDPSRVRILSPFVPLPAESDFQNVKVDEKMILFVGRIMPQKGLDRLLNALSLVKEPFRLVVDGDGTDLQKAKDLTTHLKLTDRVEFAGWAPRDRHLSYYRKASFLVLPSVWPEPFGMVGLEAMSYAKPVIAFRVGGIGEWLEDGENGFLIEPYDLKAMAEKIETFLKHPEKARAMGVQGRQTVALNFNKENYQEKLLEHYHEALRQ